MYIAYHNMNLMWINEIKRNTNFIFDKDIERISKLHSDLKGYEVELRSTKIEYDRLPKTSMREIYDVPLGGGYMGGRYESEPINIEETIKLKELIAKKEKIIKNLKDEIDSVIDRIISNSESVASQNLQGIIINTVVENQYTIKIYLNEGSIYEHNNTTDFAIVAHSE